MKKNLFFAAAATVAAVLATGCSKNDGPQPAEGNAIDFRGVVDKATRATTITNVTELSSFFVQGDAAAAATLDFMAAPVYREGTAWTYAPVKYFPANGAKINFYAYHPIKDVNMTTALAPAAGDIQFGYTVPFDQKVDNRSTDLLVASALDKNSGPVELDFAHALTGVSFLAVNENPSDESGSELTFVVHDVRIMKMENIGNFTYSQTQLTPTPPLTPVGAWSSVASPVLGDYIAGVPEAGVAIESLASTPTYNLLSKNDIMMVMPQTPALGTIVTPPNTPSTNGAYVQVTWSVKDGEGADILRNFQGNVALPAGFIFRMGHHYAFKFTFGDATNPGPWGPGNPPINPDDPDRPGGSISFDVTDLDSWEPVDQIDLMP